MVQFQRKGENYGSQKNNGELRLATMESIMLLDENSRVHADHFTALVRMEELTELNIVSLVDNNEVGGMVVIIPTTKDLDTTQKCKAIESYMLKRSFACPVYFVEDDKDVTMIYNTLQAKSMGRSASNLYTMTVSFPRTGKPAHIPEIRTIESVINGFQEGEPVASLPTILLTASYDSFSLAPSIPSSAEDGASSTVALLEILRLFHRLYDNQKTVGVYNLMFLWSSGSHLDYEGYRQWMIHSSPALFEHIEFVLCLDELATSNELYLHVSKQGQNAELRKLYSSFETVAKEMQIPFTLSFESVNIMQEYRTYPHERFALRRLLSAVLTSNPSKMTPYLAGSVLPSSVSVPVLHRNILFLAESLARFMFDLTPNTLIFNNALDVDDVYIAHWVGLLEKVPRHSFFVSKESEFIEALEKEVRSISSNTSVIDSEVDLKEEIMVFSDNAGPMNVYITKSPLFDVYTLVMVSLFLGAFYAIVALLHNKRDTITGFVQNSGSVANKTGKKEKTN